MSEAGDGDSGRSGPSNAEVGRCRILKYNVKIFFSVKMIKKLYVDQTIKLCCEAYYNISRPIVWLILAVLYKEHFTMKCSRKCILGFEKDLGGSF